MPLEALCTDREARCEISGGKRCFVQPKTATTYIDYVLRRLCTSTMYVHYSTHASGQKVYFVRKKKHSLDYVGKYSVRCVKSTTYTYRYERDILHRFYILQDSYPYQIRKYLWRKTSQIGTPAKRAHNTAARTKGKKILYLPSNTLSSKLIGRGVRSGALDTYVLQLNVCTGEENKAVQARTDRKVYPCLHKRRR